MRYLLLFVPLFLFACKDKYNLPLVGIWKVLAPGNDQMVGIVKFEKDEYFVSHPNNDIVDTYHYSTKGDTLFGTKMGSSKIDTAIIQVINNDSLRIITTKGIYSIMVRYKD